MVAQTVAELTVRSLISNGLDTLYCLPGFQLDPFMDACYDNRDKLRILHTRHEQGAAYMAMGAQVATGRPQAYCVVPGAGFLNSTGALSTAHSIHSRVLALIGQIPTDTIGKGFGVLHEIPDELGILARLTKKASTLGRAEDTDEILRDTWRALKSGPPRPVGLEIPVDLWKSDTGFAGELIVTADPGPAVDQDAVAEAARLMQSARSPLIVVGSGALDVSKDVRRLSEALSAPVVAFRNGQGVMSADAPLHVTMPVAHALWPKVDLVIGLGSRMQTQIMAWGTDGNLKIIHVTIDPNEIGRIRNPTVGLCADLGDALPALLSVLEGKEGKRDDWVETVLSEKARVNSRISEKLAAQLAWLRAIRAELPRNGILVDEITQMGYVSRFGFPSYLPRTVVTPGYQATLGYGYATALGAADARRDVPVVNFCGDGGIMFTLNELATAVLHEIPLTTVVFSDGHFGNVRGLQRDHYQGRFIATDLANPDFVKCAEAFGTQGLRATTPDELRARLREGMAHAGPTLIEVPVGEFNSPWEFIHMPRNRGL
ncbi:MAG: TPP-binding protein [Boseongicola sp. SB0677_bin_26]|nr:TPP-binding protein [Boseongicola sp. SB0677_bin_26]